MSRTDTTPDRSARARRDARRRRGTSPSGSPVVKSALVAVAVLVVGFLAFATVVTLTEDRPETASADDPSLPNPMGGPARRPTGIASGELVVGGLEVRGVEIAMGDVPLDVTMVPAWRLMNPTDAPVVVAAGIPQVLDGCCPGPVYVDDEQVAPGQEVTVPAGGNVLVEFPLQMHAGMDGPHHLTVPIAVGDEQAELHVTGNFTASAA